MSKIETFFRSYLADFGVNMRLYRAALHDDGDYPADLVFSRPTKHVQIRITGIYVDNHGMPIQSGLPADGD